MSEGKIWRWWMQVDLLNLSLFIILTVQYHYDYRKACLLIIVSISISFTDKGSRNCLAATEWHHNNAKCCQRHNFVHCWWQYDTRCSRMELCGFPGRWPDAYLELARIPGVEVWHAVVSRPSEDKQEKSLRRTRKVQQVVPECVLPQHSE